MNIIQQIEEMEKRLSALKAEMEQLQKKQQQEQQFPQKGDLYYYVGSKGVLDYLTWSNDGIDKELQSYGNVHRTHEESVLFHKRRVARHQIQLLADKSWKDAGEELDWCNQYQRKYFIRYNHFTKHLFTHHYAVIQVSSTVFHSQKAAMDAVNALGEETILLALGVK